MKLSDSLPMIRHCDNFPSNEAQYSSSLESSDCRWTQGVCQREVSPRSIQMNFSKAFSMIHAYQYELFSPDSIFFLKGYNALQEAFRKQLSDPSIPRSSLCRLDENLRIFIFLIKLKHWTQSDPDFFKQHSLFNWNSLKIHINFLQFSIMHKCLYYFTYVSEQISHNL